MISPGRRASETARLTCPADGTKASASEFPASLPVNGPLPPSPTKSIASETRWEPVARVLDANANRASEGLRVVEDYLRFLSNNRSLASECKQLRHDLQTLMQAIPESLRGRTRDVAGDVGRDTGTAQEYQRTTPEDVVRANLKRIQQALRSLEEFGKTGSIEWAATAERLRYRVYQLEKQILERPVGGLDFATLCVLIDQGDSEADFEKRTRELIEARVPLLQLRIKDLPDNRLLERARRALEWTVGSDTALIINDRPDVATLAGAHGVHLGQDDLPLATTRPLVGPQRWIGISTHSILQARRAVEEGADYIGVGPTFPSQTKSFESFPGLGLLREVAGELSIPAFAIGGVHLDNLDQVLHCGIQRVAVASAIWKAPSAGQAAREFLRRLPTLATPNQETPAN